MEIRERKPRGCGCLVAILLIIALAVAVGYATGAIAHVRYVMSGAQERGAEAIDLDLRSSVESELQDRYYAYSQLDEEDRRCYRIMYDAFLTRETRAFPASGEDKLAFIRSCVVADHPELFYVEGARLSTTYNQITELVSDATVEGTYFFDEEEAARRQAQVDVVVSAFLATVPIDAGDYEKAKLAYDYIVRTASYDHEAAASIAQYDGSERAAGQTMDDVFLDGSAVCAGYSAAYQYLLQHMGIQCVQVRGEAEGAGHAWCIALLDGAYYHIDPTWGDPQFVDGGYGGGDDYVNYDFFAVTDADMSATHQADETFALPACTATDDNYYVWEGLMFDWADTGRFGQLVSEAEASGLSAVQVRCANEEAYRGLLDGFVATGDLGYSLSDLEYRYVYDDTLLTITILP